MKIVELGIEPIEFFPYLNIQTGGRDILGNRIVSKIDLPILIGLVKNLGNDIDAIIATSDLQGTVKDGETEYLLGERLPEFLSMVLELEFPVVYTWPFLFLRTYHFNLPFITFVSILTKVVL